MPEILTESFCERCGTRYTFEAVAPKTRPLTKLKLVSKGLKNYVLSDESSLDEAFAEARSDEQRSISSQQLDAFHKAFNFCMTCRQYTCGNCWNGVEGRCLTCAPHLGHEVLPGPFPVVDTHAASHGGAVAGGNGSSPTGPEAAPMIAASAWPTVDLRPAPEPAAPASGPASPVRDAPAAEAAAAAATIAAISPDQTATAPAPLSSDERAAAAVVTTTSLLSRFRPGRRDEPEAVAAVTAASAPDEGPVAEVVETAVDVEAAERTAEPLLAEAALAQAAEAGAAETVAAEVEAAAVEPVVAEAEAAVPTAVPTAEPGVAEPAAELVVAAPDGTEPLVAEAVATAAVAGAVAGPPELEPESDLTPAELAEISAAAIAARAMRDRSDQHTEPAHLVVPERATAATPEPEPRVELPSEPAAQVAPEAAERATETAETGRPAASEPVAAGAWSMVAPESVAAPDAAAAATPAPGPDGATEGPTPVTRTDRADQPVWPLAPVQADEPQWPASPQWPPSPSGRPGEPQWPVAAMSNRGAAPAAAAYAAPPPNDSVWVESSRDVLSRSGSAVQACVSCGLPLSATARFCRRCGSRQG